MKRNRLYLAWMTAALLIMVGCSDELGNNVQQGKPIEGDGVYMTVNIITSTSGTFTKAGEKGEDPTGGEQGDGNLPGFEDENYIRSVSIIVYEGESINDPNAKIVASGYQDQIKNQGYEELDEHHGYQATVLIKGSEDFELDKQYRILAVANANVTSKYPVGQTLASVNKETVTASRVAGVSDGGFVMSSHQENGKSKDGQGNTTDVKNTVTFTEASKNSENAVTATTWVERLSARIDYIGNNNVFTVAAEGEDQPAANVTILEIAPVNVATHDTYIFKRVTAEIMEEVDLGISPFTLLGDELPNNTPSTSPSDQAGLNYVLDPTTSNLDNKTFNNAFSENLLQTIEDNSDNNELKFRPLEDIIAASSISVENNTGRERIICYTGENTMGVNSQLHGRSTGVIFKAKYDPKNLIIYENNNPKMAEGDYSTTGFFRVGILADHNLMKESKLYLDLEAAEAEYIAAGDYTGSPITEFRTNFTNATWFTRQTYKSLYETLANFQTKEDLGYYNFLMKTLEPKKESEEEITENLSWDAFEQTISWDKDFHADENNTFEQGNGKPAIHYYGTDHTCYYQYWIRHANNGDPKKMGIMEFCIVRNNVYQLDVTGVAGLGMPDPFDNIDKPDEGEEEEGYYLEVKLWVKNWVLRKNEGIILQ